MKKTKKVKQLYKHKLLLDENFPIRKYFPTLNRRFNLKHVEDDLNQEGLPDPQVYELAVKEGRLIVTRNIKDFKELAQKSDKIGVIGVSPNLTFEQIDKKLTALLTKSTKKSLLGKITIISGENSCVTETSQLTNGLITINDLQEETKPQYIL